MRITKLKHIPTKLYNKQRNNKLLLAVMAVAIILRFVGIMPNIANADEAYIQTYSWNLAHNIITKGDINPHSFKYGTLVFYFQAIGATPILVSQYLLEGINTSLSSSSTAQWLDFTSFYDEAVRKYEDSLVAAGRAQTAFWGVASVYVIYLIGKNLFNKRVGLLAAFFLAVSPLHVRDSHYITTDILSLFTILLAILFLVYMMNTKKWKWFILAGFAVGISSTIRYFPVAMLAYPIALLLTFKKEKLWLYKVIASAFFVFIGVFIGIPFFFIDPNGPKLFMEDMQKYVLPWYSTSLSNYVFSFASSLFLGGPMPDIKLLYTPPHAFRPVHISWIFFNSYGILPTIGSIIGLILALIKSPKKFMFLAIIPIFNIIYISSYIPATYERLTTPTIAFLTIFTAVAINYMYERLKSYRRVYAPIIIAIVVVIVSALPFIKSYSSSVACSQKDTQIQSYEWVDKNIPVEAKIGYLTMVSVPPKIYGAWTALEPGQKLSLEEAAEMGLDYAFLNGGRLDYNTYPFFNDFFVVPSHLYENSYYPLVLSEYHSRSEYLGKVQKPWMCDFSRIYYYKLPPQFAEGTTKDLVVNFNVADDTKLWIIQSPDQTGTVTLTHIQSEGINQSGALNYIQTPFTHTPGRAMLQPFKVKNDGTYTFSFWAKLADQPEEVDTKILARMDFYTENNPSIGEKIQEAALFMVEGPTQLYYEKKRERRDTYNDITLPGKRVALSPLITLSNEWTKISVTAQAPSEIDYATISIQPITSSATTFYIDDVLLLSD